MTDESRDQSVNDNLEDIRKEVQERVDQEAAEYPEKAETSNGRISSRFIKQCLLANELGDGILYAAVQKDRFLYSNIAREWMKWEGHHWAEDIMQCALACTEDVVDRLHEETYELTKQIEWASKKGDRERLEDLETTRETIFKRINRLRTDKGRNTCLKFARTCKDPIAIKGDELDRNPWLLACPNGVIDLRTGHFRDGRPEDLISMACPTEWKDINEQAEDWEKFLLDIQDGDEEVVAYIHRLLGYAIMGMTTERVLPVFWGKGWNGKGTIIEVLSHVLGPLASPIESEMLIDQRRPKSSAGPSPDIMALKGLRIAFASETEEGQRFSAAKVKWLTGGDELVGRYPHDKKPIHFMPTHTLILLTNHKPHAAGDDFAFWERLHLVPFKLSFVTREPQAANERPAVKGIAKKLMQNASGILAWLVRGSLLYQEKGLDPPEIIKKATLEYKKDEDLLHDFIEDHCVRDPNIKCPSSDLYDYFKVWFSENISRNVPKHKTFGTMLKKRFESSKSSGIVHYFGIDLTDEAKEKLESKRKEDQDQGGLF